MSKVPAPKTRLSNPARGFASDTQPMPRMNGGNAAGSVKSALRNARPGRAVRVTSNASGKASASAKNAAPSEVTNEPRRARRLSALNNTSPHDASVDFDNSSATGTRKKIASSDHNAALIARTPC